MRLAGRAGTVALQSAYMRDANTLVAVVLAGGGHRDRLARAVGVESKAHVPLGGVPLGEYVLAALRAAACVGRTVYVGDPAGSFSGLYDVRVPAGERLVDSLALGAGAALAQPGDPRWLLVVTADVPWLTGAAIERFVAGAKALVGRDGAPARLVYPVVTEADARAQFPQQDRTYAALADGRFTGGNLALLRADAVPALLPLMERAYRNRKNPLALARLVGLGTLLRLLLGRASVPQLERRVSDLLGAPARALISHDACLAADVDRLEHLPGTLAADLPHLTAPVDLARRT